MPLRYKIPAYAGNTLLLLLAIAVGVDHHVVLGLALAALALLDIYLTYKLDVFSREEVWLKHELEMAKMKEDLLVAQKRVAALEASAPAPAPPATPSANLPP